MNGSLDRGCRKSISSTTHLSSNVVYETGTSPRPHRNRKTHSLYNLFAGNSNHRLRYKTACILTPKSTFKKEFAVFQVRNS